MFIVYDCDRWAFVSGAPIFPEKSIKNTANDITNKPINTYTQPRKYHVKFTIILYQRSHKT